MKKIQNFIESNKKINLSQIYGGKDIPTTTYGKYGDVWHDNDDGGTLSAGDSICLNPAPPTTNKA